MNPFEMLRNEHREASAMIEALQHDDDDREETFAKLHKDLEVHARIEEELFYPALRKELGADDEVDDGREEHNEIRERLQTMSEHPTGAAPWLSALQGLKKIVTHHVDDEENEMFPMAEERLSKEFLSDLANRMKERREQLMRH